MKVVGTFHSEALQTREKWRLENSLVMPLEVEKFEYFHTICKPLKALIALLSLSQLFPRSSFLLIEC